MKTTPLWSPSAETVENLAMVQFVAEIDAAHGSSCHSCSALLAFSLRETDAFRAKGWDNRGESEGAAKGRSSVRGERCEHFEGACLNCAENLLRKKRQYNIVGSN